MSVYSILSKILKTELENILTSNINGTHLFENIEIIHWNKDCPKIYTKETILT